MAAANDLVDNAASCWTTSARCTAPLQITLFVIADEERNVFRIESYHCSGPGPLLSPRWRKTDSKSRSHRERNNYWKPLQAVIAASDLNR
jgi:hypothetical protein